MKKLRIFIVHFLIVAGIILFSFGSLMVYLRNPEARKMMEKISDKINYEILLRGAFINLFFIASVFYIFYFLIFNLLFKSKVRVKQVFLSLIYISIIISALLIILKFVSHQQLNFTVLINNLVFTFVIGGVGLGARSLIEFFNDKEEKKELEQKNLQSELSLLRSQINPHFLFNTLNNIDALIKKDSEKASDLLIKLSVQMRYMLYDSNTEKIDLSSEIEFINDYISLQKLRIKNQQAVQTDFNGEFKSIFNKRDKQHRRN